MISGTQDSILPSENGRIIADRVSAARWIEMDSIGHLPAAEAPEETADHILRFIGEFGDAPA